MRRELSNHTSPPKLIAPRLGCSRPAMDRTEIRSIDEWITSQDLKMDRSEVVRRLVEIGLKAKK